MKNLKKLSLILVLLLSLSALFMIWASAESDAPKLIDRAELLSEAEGEGLEKKLDALSVKYGHDIIVITEDYPYTADTALYARDLYEEMGYGQGEDLSGILLYIYFDTFGGGYELVTSGSARDIFDDELDALSEVFVDMLSDGDYYKAFEAFADECEYLIKYEDILPPIWIFISLIVGAVIGGIVIWSMTSKHKGVKMQKSANNYLMRSTFRLDRSRDVYLYSLVTRTVKPQNNSSSGGGRSSSGRSYGGKSGRF